MILFRRYASRAVLAAWTVLGCYACGPDYVRVMASVVSPDGALIADWYQISGGGAASARSDSVALRRAGEPFQLGPKYVFGTVDADHIWLKWQAERELEVTYMQGTVVDRQLTRWNDVVIHYRLVRRVPMNQY